MKAAKQAALRSEMQRTKDRVFVEAAGEGNFKQVERLLQCGQAVDALHPELGYAALHAVSHLREELAARASVG